MPRGAVGRADLVHLAAAADFEGMRALATRLGYRELEGPPTEVSGTAGQAAEPRTTTPQATPAPQSWAPIPLWHTVSTTFHEDAAPSEPPAEPDVSLFEPKPITRHPHPPITPWPRLWRVLDDKLRTPVARREIDARKLIHEWSRGRLVGRLPRRAGLAHARLAVMVDGSDRLMPFWRDQIGVVRALAKRLGPRSLRFLPAPSQGHRLPLLADDEKLLALSDLGALAPEEERIGWVRLGRRLHRKSGRDRLVALVPAAARLHHSAGRLREWQTIDWERPDHAVAARPEARPGREVATERVVRLASIAMRLEAGLVRQLCRLVPGTDLGTEAELWAHPDVQDRHAIGVVLAPAAARHHRRRLLEGPGDPLVEKAVEAIRRWHEGLPPEILSAEIMGWASGGFAASVLSHDEVIQARRFAAALADRLEGKGAARGGDEQILTDAWFGRFEAWAPADTWHDPRFEHDLARAQRAMDRRHPHRQPSAGVSEEALRGDPGDAELPVRRFAVRHTSRGLELFPWDEGYGGRVVEFEARRPQVVIEDGIGPVARIEVGGDGWKGGFDSPELALLTDVQAVRVEVVEKGPEWPTWAVANGRDEYGLWATFEFKGVKQRMRWIPPGRAWLGSPKDEAGRWGDELEPQLYSSDRGFWLADTPCTQQLWTAVIEENPSEFRDPSRPVESITWDQCQQFLTELRKQFPDLDARLPTEFEWEYACRAGTRTATWMGHLEIRGENDAPVLDDIAWYGGNSGVGYDLENGWDTSGWKEQQYPSKKAGTRRVATKDPNPWGLYDMLGNVFEWTSSPWGAQADGSARRVFRGGSWVSVAQYVRAAYRFWNLPGNRLDILGFRLSLGREPEAEPREESRRPVPAAASERGTSRSSPGRDSGGGGLK